jgi:hypothetical protein
MMQIRNGQPMVVVVFILSVFIIGFLWVIMSKPLGITYDYYREDPSIVGVQDYQTFYNVTRVLWLWFPFVGIVALIIWALTEAHRKDDTYG